jgi:hypothetical protein
VTTVFESKDAYKKFAASEEQNKRFHQINDFFAAEPEWHDGEVIHRESKVVTHR